MKHQIALALYLSLFLSTGDKQVRRTTIAMSAKAMMAGSRPAPMPSVSGLTGIRRGDYDPASSRKTCHSSQTIVETIRIITTNSTYSNVHEWVGHMQNHVKLINWRPAVVWVGATSIAGLQRQSGLRYRGYTVIMEYILLLQVSKLMHELPTNLLQGIESSQFLSKRLPWRTCSC